MTFIIPQNYIQQFCKISTPSHRHLTVDMKRPRPRPICGCRRELQTATAIALQGKVNNSALFTFSTDNCVTKISKSYFLSDLFDE